MRIFIIIMILLAFALPAPAFSADGSQGKGGTNTARELETINW